MPIKCEFYNHGCTQWIRREDLEDHHAKNGRRHARLVAEDKGWHSQEIEWGVDSAIIRVASGIRRHVLESDRVEVGGYRTLVRLATYRGEYHLFICVEDTSVAPDIDRVNFKVEDEGENLVAWVDTEKAPKMESDGSGNDLWLVGGTLKCKDENSGEGGSRNRNVTRRDILQWCAGADKLIVSVSFRLKQPESINVDSANPSNTHVGEGFWRFLELD
jgi:hypothetical protein